MGDVVPFKKPSKKAFTNTVLWGEGMFGFNPYLLKYMFIANEVNICFMFHEPVYSEVGEPEDPQGWELMVKCYNAEECKAAYKDLVDMLRDNYGLDFTEKNDI